MTAKLYRLQELAFADEASFMENATSVTSNAYDTNIPFLSATCSFEQPRETDQTVQARKNVTRPGFLGLRTGTIEFQTYWCGPSTDPGAGAVATHWLTTLLGYGLGGILITDDGGTISSATDGDTFVTTGVTAITPGTIIRVGAKGDGRADGQPGVVSSWAAGNTQLLTTLPATPNAADAVRVTTVTYPTETNPATTLRFRFSLMDSGAQFHAVGCQLEQLTFETDMAGARPPRVTWRYRMAYWDRGTVSMPTGTNPDDTDTAVIAGGSLYVQTFATATRAIEECGSLSLTLDMGLVPQMGPAASQPSYTNITGWVSNGCRPTLTWTIPYSTQPATDFDSDGTSTTYKHILFAANGTAGRSVGFYMPRAFPIGAKPTYTDVGGLTYVTKVYQGTESTTTSTELTRSAIRFFQG